MTSPESRFEEAEPRTDGGSPSPATLFAGNLHPAVLVLRLLDGLRQSILPALLGVFDRWFLVLALVLFLVHVGQGLARYLTYHYRLTDAELVIREGILHRQERRIPIDRVQDLGFESTILRRLLGITVVRVETASGKGAEATLDSLGRSDAEELRELLLEVRQRQRQAVVGDVGEAAVAVAEAPEWSVHRAVAGELLLRGMTDLRLGAMVVAGMAALELADQLGIVLSLQGAANSFYAWLQGFPLALAALILLTLVLCVIGFGVAVAAIGNLMAFHGFELSLRQDSLLCRYGLLTTRQKTLPRGRIQRLRVEQTWLRRLLSLAVLRADSAGSTLAVGEEAPGGFDVLVPMSRLEQVEALLPAALPGLVSLPTEWNRASRRLVWRVCLKGLLAALAASALLSAWLGPLGLLALLWVPLAWLVGRLAWANLAWVLGGGHLFLRWGILGRYHVYLPLGKVQAVSLQSGPVQRLLGLCDLSVYVAGGPPTRIPDLAIDEALLLQRQLAGHAARSAAVEWGATLRRGVRPSPAG